MARLFLIAGVLWAALVAGGCTARTPADESSGDEENALTQNDAGKAPAAAVRPEDIQRLKSLWEKGRSNLRAGIELANAYSGTGDTDAARAVLDQVIKVFPKNTWALREMGFVLLAQMDAEGARAVFEKCLAEAKRSQYLSDVPSAMAGMGEAALLRGDEVAALEWYRKAIDASGGKNIQYFEKRIAQIQDL